MRPRLGATGTLLGTAAGTGTAAGGATGADTAAGASGFDRPASKTATTAVAATATARPMPPAIIHRRAGATVSAGLPVGAAATAADQVLAEGGVGGGATGLAARAAAEAANFDRNRQS